MHNQAITLHRLTIITDGATFAADQFAFDPHFTKLCIDMFHEKHFVACARYQLCVYGGEGVNGARFRSPQAYGSSGYIELLSCQAWRSMFCERCWQAHYHLGALGQ